METIPPVSPIDIATEFALNYRGFNPGVSPLQTEHVHSAIDEFASTGSYDPTNRAPVEELGVLAFCRITHAKPPENLRWQWYDPVILIQFETWDSAQIK